MSEIESFTDGGETYSDDDLVVMCGSCGMFQNTEKMERDAFLNAGHSTSCRLCGGVCVITYRQRAAQTLNTLRQRRGLPPQ